MGAYTSDPHAVHASKYLLLTSIEDALSAANHVIASEGYRAPADYADAFRSLREAGILNAELADRLEAMARFRNLLIQQYAEVDDHRVHQYLQQDLDGLDAFIVAILDASRSWVEPEPGAATRPGLGSPQWRGRTRPLPLTTR